MECLASTPWQVWTPQLMACHLSLLISSQLKEFTEWFQANPLSPQIILDILNDLDQVWSVDQLPAKIWTTESTGIASSPCARAKTSPRRKKWFATASGIRKWTKLWSMGSDESLQWTTAATSLLSAATTKSKHTITASRMGATKPTSAPQTSRCISTIIAKTMLFNARDFSGSAEQRIVTQTTASTETRKQPISTATDLRVSSPSRTRLIWVSKVLDLCRNWKCLFSFWFSQSGRH